MAHTFRELVEKQRAADQAHARVLELRDTYGSPTHEPWNEAQKGMYETAWRAWRDLDRDVQAAVTEYASGEGRSRADVEAEVRKELPGPAPSTEG